MKRAARRACLALVLACVAVVSCARTAGWPVWQKLALPFQQGDVVRFAVIGDSGTGGRQQYEVASRMAEFQERFPFDFVLMLGDNLYGGEEPKDFAMSQGSWNSVAPASHVLPCRFGDPGASMRIRAFASNSGQPVSTPASIAGLVALSPYVGTTPKS